MGSRCVLYLALCLGVYGSLDGVDLRIAWPEYGEEVASHEIEVAIKLDVGQGRGADSLRKDSNDWFVCYQARGYDERRCLGVASQERMEALVLTSGDQIIDAWIEQSGSARYSETSVYFRVKAALYAQGCRLALPCAFDQEILVHSDTLQREILVHHRLYGIFSDDELRMRLGQGYNSSCDHMETCVHELVENTIRFHFAPKCGCYNDTVEMKSGSLVRRREKPKVYLINLDRRPERLKFAMDQFKASSFQVRRLSAVDGASHIFTAAEMSLFRNADFLRQSMWSSMNIVRRLMANLLSHYAAWTALIDSGEASALIFQDDLSLTSDFETKVERLLSSALDNDLDLIWLSANRGVHEQWTAHPLSAAPEDYAEYIGGYYGRCIPEICQPCSGAYIVTRRGAQWLKKMAIERGFEHQTDIWMNKLLIAHNRHFVATPLLATTQNSKLRSDVFLFTDEEKQRMRPLCTFQDFDSPEALAEFARSLVIQNNVPFTDKFEHHGYQRAYYKYLRQLPCRREPVYRILEIGIGFTANIGASALVWRKLFGPEAILHYLELQGSEDLTAFLAAHRGVIDNVFFGDQRLPESFQFIQEPYDIIIDDGGHCAECMINTIKTVLPQLKPGGIFFLEDAHVWYSPDFNPPFLTETPSSSILQFLNELQQDQLCLAVQAVCPLIHPEISKLIASIDCMREICIITRAAVHDPWDTHFGPCSGTRRCDCYRTDAPKFAQVIYPCIPEAAAPTSISDTAEYTAFVDSAVMNDAVFSTFKSHPSYHVLEHLRPECGELYVSALKYAKCDKFLQLPDPNINLGSPRTYKSALLQNRTVSPTTLRYLKVACDLDSLFPLHKSHLVEIGVGYGGQIQALSTTGLDRVTLVDLPAVQRLAHKYLQKTAPSLNIHLWKQQKLDTEIDLLISNYAFSELSSETQDLYIEKLLKPAKRAYLTINPFSGHCKQWPLTNFFRILNNLGKKVYVANEVPLSWWQIEYNQDRPRNTIILWGLPEDEPNIIAFIHRWKQDSISSFIPLDQQHFAPICQLSWLTSNSSSSSTDSEVLTDLTPYLVQQPQHDAPSVTSTVSATPPPKVTAFTFGGEEL